MKLWFTLAEFAAFALPGLPGTARSLYRLAEHEGWHRQPGLARKRAGRGGGWEYRVECLPAEARLLCLARLAGPEAGAAEAALAPDPVPGMPVPPGAAEARDARLHLVGQFKAWHGEAGLGLGEALAGFVRLYRAGEVPVPDWVRQAAPRLSVRSLRRWLQAVRSGAVEKLAVDRGAARRGKGILDEAEDGALRLKVLALLAHQPHLSADHVRTLCRDAFGDTVHHRGRDVPLPSLRAFQMVLKGLRATHRSELLALHDPDAFKSRLRISGSHAHRITRVNELWQIDASPADLLCTDGRHTVYVCIDVFSRRIIASLSRFPRAEAVGLLLKKALLAWGVPERIKTDNGSDFTARATRRLLASLKIETETAAPFSPEQKGVVERAIGTLQRDLMPTLPGFIGHSVAQRKAIENRKAFSARRGQDDARAFAVELTARDLAGYVDRWCAERYAHRPHGGLGRATPFQMAARCPAPLRRIGDEAALGVLLAPVAGKDGLRQVGKQGLRIDGAFYLAPGLLPGETVLVRMDPFDLGRVFVFAEDGDTFRCLAFCPELAGLDPAEAVRAAQAAQKAYLAERLAPLRKEAARIRPRDMADALARQAARDAGKLAEFPRPARPHLTSALAGAAKGQEALDIARRRRAPEPRQASTDEAAMLARIEAEAPSGTLPAPAGPTNLHPLRRSETRHQRFRRALALEARLEAGEQLPNEEAIWLGSFRQSADYRALKALHEEFGEEVLRMS